MQTAQVIFFPVKWFPPFVEIDRLQNIQAEMRGTFSTIKTQCKTKYEYAVRKQALHEKLKENIELVKN